MVDKKSKYNICPGVKKISLSPAYNLNDRVDFAYSCKNKTGLILNRLAECLSL